MVIFDERIHWHAERVFDAVVILARDLGATIGIDSYCEIQFVVQCVALGSFDEFLSVYYRVTLISDSVEQAV